MDITLNVKAFSRLQEALGDVVAKEVDKTAAKVITEIDSSSKNWGVPPLSTVFSSLGFSAVVAQTEVGSRAIAEAARYEYERAAEARRRDNWVVDWDYTRNRIYYLYWYSYQTIPSRETHIVLRDNLEHRQWEAAIDDLTQIESAFREFQRYLVEDNVLDYEQASYFIDHSLTRLRVWGLDGLEYQNSRFNQDIHSSYRGMYNRSTLAWERGQYRDRLYRGGWDIEYVEIGCNCLDCRREREKTDKSGQKAKDLLLSCLTQSQKEEFKNTESFIVVSPSGNKYRIKLGKSFNVVPLTKKGKEKSLKLCAGPKGLNPYDWVLAQKCLLEADEEEFLRVANKNIEIVRFTPHDY